MTKIVFCTCAHGDQDKMYGSQQRVANWAVKKASWRCTVCGSLKGDTAPAKKK